MIPRHKNTLFHQNFPFKAVITLDEMKTHSLDMKQQYQKQKGKSSPNILCLTGREVHNGHIQFERSVLSMIKFSTMKRKHKLHYFVVDKSNKFSTCSICGTKKIRKIIGWGTKDRGDINQ